MVKLYFILFLLALGVHTKAEMPAQRNLAKNDRVSFVQAYIHLSSVTEMETPLLERCLEEVYLGAPSQSTCLTAVKSLTSKPLNQPRREVLFSFLAKLEKAKSQQKNFYRDLKQGLLRTHPHLARTFGVSVPDSEDSLAKITALEMKAWKKAVVKKFPLDEIALLINGKKVAQLESWTAPQGVYQWTLVSNTHGPIVRLGTFSQFASESLKELKPLAQGNCQNIQDLEAQKHGLLQIEVFADKKCIAQFGMKTTVGHSDHLGKSTNIVKMEKTSSRHWVWPILAVVVVGLATSLNGKQVSFHIPSFR